MAVYARGNPARWWRSGGSWAGGHRSPAGMFISPFRKSLSLLALAFLICVLYAGWFVTRPARLSQMASVLLSEVIGGQVEVDSANISYSGTLILNGVTLRTDKGTDPALTVFSAEQLEVRFDWMSLVTGHLEATQITAIRAALHLTEDHQSGAWNYERLFTRQHRDSGDKDAPAKLPVFPVIVLREAEVRRGEVIDGHYTQADTTVIDGRLIPRSAVPGVYDIHITERPGPASHAKIESTSITMLWDVDNNVFTADIGDIPLTPELRKSLPRQAREIWDHYSPHGRLTALHMAYHPKAGWMLHVELRDVGLSVELDEHVLPTREKYRIDFRNVRGALDIAINDGNVRFKELAGDIVFDEPGDTLISFPFKANGEIRGTAPESRFDVALEFLNAKVGIDSRHPGARVYPQVAYVIPQSRDLIARLSPRGTADMRMTLRRSQWNGNVAVQGHVDCRDMEMRFTHFPFPLYAMSGPIDFDNDIVSFGNAASHVTAMADAGMSGPAAANIERAQVDIWGEAGLMPENQHIDFNVTSRNAVFDERVRACIPQQFEKIWDSFDPRVRGAFTCHIVRNKNSGVIETSLVIDIVDGRANYAELPYQLRGIRGRVSFADHETRLENVHARTGLDGSGELIFNGVVRHPAGDLSNLQPDIHITGHNLPIDAALLGALPQSYTHWRTAADVAGRIDFDADVKRIPDASIDYSARVSLKDGRFQTKDGVYSLAHIAATAQASPAGLVIEKLTANAGEHAAIDLSGKYAEGALNLDARAEWRDFGVTETPPTFITGDMAGQWIKFKPQGTVSGDLQAKILLTADQIASLGVKSVPATVSSAPATGSAATVPASSAMASAVQTYTLHLRTADLRLAPADWPAVVEKISASATITPDLTEVTKLTAVSGKAALAAEKITYSRVQDSIELSGTIDSPEIPTAWLGAMGKDAADSILSQKPEGDIRLELKELSRPGADKPWTFDGVLTSKLLKLSTGPDSKVPVECRDMKITASGAWDPAKAGDALSFAGKIETTSLTLQNRLLEKFAAAMECKEKAVAFTNLDAAVATGKLQGNITIHYDEPLRYDGTLVLNDAELSALALPATATKAERDKIGTGRVTATLAVQEQFGKNADRTGRGALIVKKGKIYNVPLAMGLMQLATLRLPLRGAFESANMTYYIRDNKVTFERIALESPGFSLLGAGTVTVHERNLDITFVTNNPGENIPFLTGIMQVLREQLLQVHVTGTLEKPIVETVTFPSLGKTLEQFMPHPKEP